MKENSMNSWGRKFINKFMANRMAVGCLYGLGIFYLLAIFAPMLAPYHYALEDRNYSFCPPSVIHFQEKDRLVWPYIYARTMRFNENHQRIYEDRIDQKFQLTFLKKGKLFGVQEPGRLYLLGADSRGRDILSRLLYGARISLSIGLLGVMISFIIGLIVGGCAGYYGGWIDGLLMRICEMFMLVPSFYLMLAIRAAMSSNFNSLQVYFMVVIILAFIGWASLARIIRGMALSLRHRDYVHAAKLLGCSDIQIIFKHILPHTVSYSLAAMMLAIPGYILGEAGLSLIGLGIQDPTPSWGNMLSDAMGIVYIQSAPWILLPGLVIFLTVFFFNVVGDALRDSLDPLTKGV